MQARKTMLHKSIDRGTGVHKSQVPGYGASPGFDFSPCCYMQQFSVLVSLCVARAIVAFVHCGTQCFFIEFSVG